MIEPVHVPPQHLRTVWPVIEPMLAAVRERAGEGWLPEDIFAAAINGRAGVYTSLAPAGAITGVVVLEKTNAWGVSGVHVWACYHKDHQRTVADFWPWVVDQARAWGCSRVTLQSPRRMDRVLPVKPVSTIYACEV